MAFPAPGFNPVSTRGIGRGVARNAGTSPPINPDHPRRRNGNPGNTRRKRPSIKRLPADGLFFADHAPSGGADGGTNARGMAVDGSDGKTTILVVDDNSDNVEILRAFLESRGFT
jgi:CheY-like chemotaxis protein